MFTVKIGMMPGRINEFAIANGTTVEGALSLAGIDVGAESEVRLDGEVVALDKVLDSSSNILLVTKRIKGATYH